MDVIDYGVCRLSLIPMRMEPSHKAEQANQLLFGEHYEVLEADNSRQWIRIRTNFDRYEGWINGKQHHSVSREYFLYNDKAEFKITTELTTSMLYHKSRLIILLGSIIPISSSELFKMEEQFAFNGEAKNLGLKREYDFLKAIAFKYLNSPYQWGGKSPFGIDCSGFVQMVFKICGYRLYRDSLQQAGQGKSVGSFHDAIAGDLAFFTSGSKSIDHVGIVLEEDKIIHASGRVRIDHFTEEGILNLDTKIFTHELVQVKRVII
jgi:gamma-D-glutamyl-L-lysine dipeptidyl-peptidase